MNHFQQSSDAQRTRILSALRVGPVTTIEMMRKLDIIRPSARINELRAAGYNIKTYWTSEQTECGDVHRVAKYVLEPQTASLATRSSHSPSP